MPALKHCSILTARTLRNIESHATYCCVLKLSRPTWNLYTLAVL